MKVYYIYWIQEKIAQHFYYKNDLLYRFIKTYHKYQEREDLALQFQYITKKIPITLFLSHLSTNQKEDTYINIQNNQIKIGTASTYITLHIYEKYIEFQCQTLEDAEYLLFPILRLFYPYFFIVGINHNNFGWVSSATSKYRKKNINEVLYSQY